jgi:hypothetical protein
MGIFRKNKKQTLQNLPEDTIYVNHPVRPLVNTGNGYLDGINMLAGRFGPNGLINNASQNPRHKSGLKPNNYQLPEVPPPQSLKNAVAREQKSSATTMLRMLRDKLPGLRDKHLKWRTSYIVGYFR